MNARYRVDWHPQGYGFGLAVYDARTGLVVASAGRPERAAVDELVRLANVGQWTETAATDTTPAATDDNP